MTTQIKLTAVPLVLGIGNHEQELVSYVLVDSSDNDIAVFANNKIVLINPYAIIPQHAKAENGYVTRYVLRRWKPGSGNHNVQIDYGLIHTIYQPSQQLRWALNDQIRTDQFSDRFPELHSTVSKVVVPDLKTQNQKDAFDFEKQEFQTMLRNNVSNRINRVDEQRHNEKQVSDFLDGKSKNLNLAKPDLRLSHRLSEYWWELSQSSDDN